MALFRGLAITKPSVTNASLRYFATRLPRTQTARFSSAVTSTDSMNEGQMYNWRVAAVENALAKRGKATGPLTMEDLLSLGHLDQYHYYGVEACDHLATTLGLDDNSKVLDIGSGIGGPGRYMAMRTGCDVTGVEMQAALSEAATQLTARVGLSERVRFLTGDFVSLHQGQASDLLQKGSFDHVISQLVFLHIPDRHNLLKATFECTKPGGTFYIEDFARVEGKAFTDVEARNLKNVVHAQTVTSTSEYFSALEEAGFVDIQTEDLSEGWATWSMARYQQYEASKDATVKMHGEVLFHDRLAFYKVIAELFDGGNLGGVRLTGRKRSVAEAKLLRGRAKSTQRCSQAVLNEYGSVVANE